MKIKLAEQVETFDLVNAIINKPIINLDFSGILFVAACSNFQQGEKHFLKLELKISNLNKEIEKNRLETGDFTDNFKTSMFRKLRELELLYEPVVRYFSAVKILLVNSSEAYINEVADCELVGKQFNEFDKLSLVGKWLFISPIIKCKLNLTLDKNPLQGFATLVRERNKLVHFKSSRVTLKNPELPNFLEEFNLTPSSCKSNIENVKKMIIELSKNWIGSNGPDWLNALSEKKFRRPCFYMTARNCASYLYSKRIDPDI